VTAAPRVSLLMPVRNRAHLLDRVLERLAENTTYQNLELVTVDDRSEDASVEVLRRWAASGRIADMRVLANRGAGAISALNTALDAAEGELCVQLDDDVTVETYGWVEQLVELMLTDDRVGVVTGKVVFDSGGLQCCGVNVVSPAGWHERPMMPSEPIGERRFLNRVRDRPEEGGGGQAERRPAEVDSGIGCCMMYRRDAALEAGGYDEHYSPVWFDDVDLCIAIRRLGLKAFCLPQVRAIHHFAARGGAHRRADLRTVRAAAIRNTAGRLPAQLRAVAETRWDVDFQGHFTREQCTRLRHHHAYWRRKWGWDALNPDMDEVRRRWGGTEICWATDPDRRMAGEDIVAAFEARRAPAGAVPA
jgi:GT2 family glycosyltransferase